MKSMDFSWHMLTLHSWINITLKLTIARARYRSSVLKLLQRVIYRIVNIILYSLTSLKKKGYISHMTELVINSSRLDILSSLLSRGFVSFNFELQFLYRSFTMFHRSAGFVNLMLQCFGPFVVISRIFFRFPVFFLIPDSKFLFLVLFSISGCRCVMLFVSVNL